MELDEFQNAINEFDKYISINPEYYNSWYFRGSCKYALEDFKGAIDDYDKVLEINPKHIPSLWSKALAKGALKDYQGAINDYSSVLEIDPKDIAYIQPKQAVRISLTAYDASKYGTIDGEVIKVSPDAVEDKASGLSHYFFWVSINSELREDDGSIVEILPGMVASVDVLAGKRTILDYIWNPMLKIKERALTD